MRGPVRCSICTRRCATSSQEGSDLHLKVGSPPLVRDPRPAGADRGLRAAEPPRTPSGVLREMLDEHPRSWRSSRPRARSTSPTRSPALARFRVNAFRQRGSISIVARVIPFAVRTVDELGLPPVITELADEERGLILLTGTTGSGQVDDAGGDHRPHQRDARRATSSRSRTRSSTCTRDRNSIINQREVGMDTGSFSRAMRRVLRQDPDVILIGEMRDEETVRTAPVGRRDRPPRALDRPHARRAGDGQPDHRLLPAARAEPGPRDARRHAARASSPSAWCRTPDGDGRVACARSCG